MSRGLGSLQQQIVSASRADPSTASDLLWRIADGRLEGNQIPNSLYGSFRRAIRRLEQTSKISITRRKLQNIDEVVRLFPSKTRNKDVRNLRLRLLPAVATILKNRRGQFSPASQEKYMVSRLDKDDGPRLSHARARWLQLEDRLYAAIGQTAPRHSECDLLILVLLKGREHFTARRAWRLDATVTPSLAELLAKMSNQGAPSTLTKDIEEFYASVFTAGERSHIELKNLLYDVLASGVQAGSYVHQRFKDELLELEPDYVESLPGHEPANSRVRGKGSVNLDALLQPKYSDLLDTLVNRHVFSKFQFVVAS